MAAAKKNPTTTVLEVDPALPRKAQIFSLGLAVLKFAKKATWAELEGKGPDGLALTVDQVEMISANLDLLALIRNGITGSPINTTTIAVCGTCDRWAFAGDSLAASCTMTLDCPGKPAKVARAKATTFDLDDNGQRIDPPPADPKTPAERKPADAAPEPDKELPKLDPLVAEVIMGLPAAAAVHDDDPGAPTIDLADAPADYNPAEDWSDSYAPSAVEPGLVDRRAIDDPRGYDPAEDWSGETVEPEPTRPADESPPAPPEHGDEHEPVHEPPHPDPEDHPDEQHGPATDPGADDGPAGRPGGRTTEEMDAETLRLMMEEYG